MNFFEVHRTGIGVLADLLTFLGGACLAKDAFGKLRELKRVRTNDEFRKRLPNLNLTDKEWKAAIISMRWTLAGFGLVTVGFLFQLLLRFMEVTTASVARIGG
ncbi:MAG: hypothetical protein ACRD3K_11950 [Edaphobacter sp.]